MSAEREEFEAALDAMWRGDLGGRAQVAAIFDRIVGERERIVSHLAHHGMPALHDRAPVEQQISQYVGVLRAERDAAIKEARLTSLKHTPEWNTTRTDSELASLFDHMGYADGDAGYLCRYFSYGDGARIKQVFAERDAALSASVVDTRLCTQARAERDAAVAGLAQLNGLEDQYGDTIDGLRKEARLLYDANEHNFSKWMKETAVLRAEVAALAAALERIREREAACCPEDVPFNEHIAALTAENERLRAALGHATYRNHAPSDWCDGCVGVLAALASRATEGTK